MLIGILYVCYLFYCSLCIFYFLFTSEPRCLSICILHRALSFCCSNIFIYQTRLNGKTKFERNKCSEKKVKEQSKSIFTAPYKCKQSLCPSSLPDLSGILLYIYIYFIYECVYTLFSISEQKKFFFSVLFCSVLYCS